MRVSAVTLATTAALLLSAAPRTGADADALARAADAALAAGDARRAAALYADAAERTTDPGRVAFNAGCALAELGDWAAAEAHFRRCGGDPARAAAAWHNAGTCLLRLAGPDDASRLRAAAACFEACLRNNHDAATAAAARSNLELAKVRLLAARPGDDPPPGDDPSDGGRGPDGDDPPGRAEGAPKGRPGGERAGAEPGAEGEPADATPPEGGPGRLPVLTDDPDAPPLSAAEAAALLGREAARIDRARRAGRGGRPASLPGPARDW